MALIAERTSAKIIRFLDRQLERALTTPKLGLLDRAFEKLAGKAPELGRERLVASTGSSGTIINPNLLMSTSGTGGGPVIAPEFPTGIVTGKKGSYRIMSEFAEGGMSKIYLVQDMAGKYHLLKVILDFTPYNLTPAQQEELHARFEKEILILGRISNRQIPTLIDSDPAASPRFFAMEHIEGKSLFSVINEGKRINPITSGMIISQVLQALIVFGQSVAPSGSEQFAHRDIKPENIMLELKNDRIRRVVLIDFGIAKLPNSTLTGVKEYRGTPSYSAPETITSGSSVADQRSDNYALGAVLYWLFTGEESFDFTKDRNLIFQFMADPKSHIDRLKQTRSNFKPEEKWKHAFDAMWAIAFKAMNPDPNDRYQDYQRFKAAIDLALLQ